MALNLLEFFGMSRQNSKYLYLLLLFFPLILFSAIIFSGKAIFWGTPLTQFIPWWTLAWQMVEKGLPPLWNSLSGMGAPLMANYQSALLYPPTWIYFLLYNVGGVALMAWGQAVMIVLHLFWAGLGMALFIRQLGFGKLAQIIAGLSFGMSGYLVSRAGFLSINAAVSWIPWIMLGITKLVDAAIPSDQVDEVNRNQILKLNSAILSAFILLFISFAMQLLAGHAQTAWYTLIFSVFWLAFLLYSRVRRGRTSGAAIGNQQAVAEEVRNDTASQPAIINARFAVKDILVVILLFGIVLVLASALAAGQLLPTGEYLLQSQRSSSVEYEFAMTYSFWPWRFLTFLAPDLYGNPAWGDYWGYANYWEDAIYIGLIPFLLAVYAVLTRGKRLGANKYISNGLMNFLLLVIVIVFIIALGQNTPIFPWLYSNVVTFDMFQAPTRITILALFCISVLSAIGLDSWRRPGGRGLYWLRLGVMAAAAVTVGALLAYYLSRFITLDIRPSFIRSAALLGIFGVGFGLLALKAPQKNELVEVSSWGWWQWAVVLLVGIDLTIAGWGLNPAAELNLYSQPSPTAEEVNNLLSGGRLYLSSDEEYDLKYERFLRFDTFHPFSLEDNWDELRASLLPNVAILDGIPSVNNFDPLIPGRYSTWMTVLGQVSIDEREKMLDLMSASVLESMNPVSANGVQYYGRETAYPRYRWAGCGIPAESGEEAFSLILQNQVDHEKKVILESPGEAENYVCGDSKAAIRLISEQDHKSVLLINSYESGYLVLSDLWYPGWRASVDGAEVPILIANYLFRAVKVPPGSHEVTIEYEPNIFKIGIITSGLSFLILLSLISYWFAAGRKINTRDEEQASNNP